MKKSLISAMLFCFFQPLICQVTPRPVIKDPNKIQPINKLPENVLKNHPVNNDILKGLNVPDNWDFETGNLTGWNTDGTAFSNQPTVGAVSVRKTDATPSVCWDGTITPFTDVDWNPGFHGSYWISSGENHPNSTAPLSNTYISNTTGSLLSKTFIASGKWISFLMAGKSALRRCSVDILILDDGTVSHSDTILQTGETVLVGNRPTTMVHRFVINYPVVNYGGQTYIVVSSIVNTEDKNDVIRTEDLSKVAGLNSAGFKRVMTVIAEKHYGHVARIRVTDNDITGHIAVDDFRFETTISPQPVTHKPAQADCPLQGFVDLHTHPMSYLGFGRKAVHGALDTGSIIPAGTHGCNTTAFRATSIEEALGSCNSTHGGWGLTENTCGDYLRAAIINYALDADFKYIVSFDRNPHGDHEHAGYPNFSFWPHQSSILHQQMWVDWIRRAHKGGINTIVALTVNSELLAEITNGDGPYDDKSVADTQIVEMKSFVSRHSDFMEIAYTPADMRRIVKQGKLAVILGMEVDKIGNFGKPGVVTTEATVRAEIRRLFDRGIRYIFPVHLIDNSFGGTAVYSMLFNFANKHANGYHFNVTTAPDPNIRYNAGVKIEGVATPVGLDNALILGVRGLLDGIGQIPAPCINDIRCLPPPGKISCCGSYQNIVNIMSPSPQLDVYKTIPGGHMNVNGLTPLGEIAINEMMKLGMMIDIDHMGERSMTRAIEIAEGIPGGYPLLMGHNAIRGTNEHTMKERSAPTALVSRLAALGGMFGVGTSDLTPEEFITNANNAWSAMGNKNIAIGTDVNGFEKLPKIGASTLPLWKRESNVNEYDRIFGFCRTGNKTWNYFTEGGVSHYGMMPEFFWDVKNYTGGTQVINNLTRSVENLARLWEKLERQKLTVH